MKTAIVTGGTKGIGLGIATELLKQGYFVYINYANDDMAANNASMQLSEISYNFSIIKASQANKEEFYSFIERIDTEVETVDCIVCNAGLTLRKPAMEITDREWEEVMQVSVNSHFYLIRNLFHKIPQNSRIIFIGSMMGVYPHATSLPYGVSKSAVHALAKNLVKEFAGTGTTVNAIAPGFVETPWQKDKPQEIRNNICRKTAQERFAEIDEIVNAVNFCLGNPFVNGSILEVSGGYNYQ